jgi:hypothetical protein
VRNQEVESTFDVGSELKPLPSAGITQHPQYCGPFRHPIAPGLAVAGFRLVDASTTQGASRVASIFLLHACRRHYPGGIAKCIFRSLPLQYRPSPKSWRVGFHITSFETCSAFTRVMASILTKSLS